MNIDPQPAGPFRRKQTRRMTLKAVRLDLPPDLAVAIGFLVKKTGLPAEQIIFDMLRDSLGSPPFSTAASIDEIQLRFRAVQSTAA
jgi:hypothetical protein